MGHVAAVRCVQYDGRRVVSGAYDFMVKVWDPETETCLHTLQGHTNRVYSLQVRRLSQPREAADDSGGHFPTVEPLLLYTLQLA